jgi:hypothetical protein
MIKQVRLVFLLVIAVLVLAPICKPLAAGSIAGSGTTWSMGKGNSSSRVLTINPRLDESDVWQQASDGLNEGGVFVGSIAMSPAFAADRTLFVSTGFSGVYKSSDA